MRSRVSCYRPFAGAMVFSMAFVGSAHAQDPAGQQLAAIKQAMAVNQQALLHYTWIETTQMSYKGTVKSSQSAQCEYGPDGKVVKTPIGPPPPPPSKPPGVRGKIAENKEDEIKAYMDSVKVLVGLYVPPDPEKLQLVYKAGNASLSSAPSSGTVSLIFKNYAQLGDALTLSFVEATKAISGVNVNTYLNDPKGVVTLSVQFATLADGTNHQSTTVLDATAQEVQVTVTNSDYQKLAQ